MYGAAITMFEGKLHPLIIVPGDVYNTRKDLIMDFTPADSFEEAGKLACEKQRDILKNYPV